jgi:4-amino-4-deoxy-L-arabinose transferase-like glycosyltransferase
MIRPLHLILLAGFGIVLLSLGNWILPLIDRDEPRFAEAAREMWQSGDYFIPRLNGEYRFDKPPLIYWCQALAYGLFGDNDFATRLPSVLFAVCSVIVTAIWGARLFGARIGLWAGLFLLTCLQVFVHGRAAVADFPMVTFFLLASWAAWERQLEPRRLLWWWIFYLALAFGFLAKGPVALLPIVFVPVYRWIQGYPRAELRWKSAAAGLLLVVLIVGAWGIPALLLTNGEYLRIGIGWHVVQRSFAAMEDHGATSWIGYLLLLPFYLVTIFVSFLPWSFLLPGTVQRLTKLRLSQENFLIGAVTVTIVVFSLLQTKLPHYILPCFPMVSLLIARQLDTRPAPVRTLVVTAVIYVVIATVGFSAVRPLFVSEAVARQLSSLVQTRDFRIASLGYDEQSLIWYLRGRTTAFQQRLKPKAFSEFMSAPGEAVCVINREQLARVQLDPAWQSFHTQGYNFARWELRPISLFGRPLTLLLPEPVDLVTVMKR